jgi:beta-lactamase class A
MFRFLVSVLALVPLAAGATGTPAPVQGSSGAGLLQKQLVERLDRVASRLDGLVGYTIIDLTSGERIERLPAHVFPTASSIKIAILFELFKQADEGRLSLDAAVPWNASHAVGGSGVLFELTSPTLSLRDYATLMIVLSDNTATNVLIDRVGMDAVNARMKSLDLSTIVLRRKMMDLKAAVAGRENVATPADLAELLVAISKGDGLTPSSRDALLAILKKEKSSPMLRGIPEGVEVASKPGDLDGVRADAGIVYVPNRPYVFVAMAGWLRDDSDGERAIEDLSRACYEYFSRVAESSEFGRKIQ